MTYEIRQQPVDAAERQKGIGGSDIAAIAGLCPWKSPLDVYLEKVGEKPAFEGNEYTKWGQALEDVIAKRYAEETGREVVPGGFIAHPARPWQRGNVDRLCPAEKILLEIKTAGARQAYRWGDPGADEVPEEYIAQVQWYLELLPDYDHAEIPALIGGNDYRVYRVERNKELGASLVTIAEAFWRDRVLKRSPPPVDGSDSAREWLARRFPREVKPLLSSTPAADEWALKLKTARTNRLQAEADEALAENRLKELIGEATGLEGSWGRVTWKARKGSVKTDWQAIAKELAPAAEVVARHTKETSGARVFLTRFTEEG